MEKGFSIPSKSLANLRLIQLDSDPFAHAHSLIIQLLSPSLPLHRRRHHVNARGPHLLPWRFGFPIFNPQAGDAFEFAGVVGDERQIERKGLAAELQIIGADLGAVFL